jgi:3-oxoacyl-[acyl-carrier protein] reductase
MQKLKGKVAIVTGAGRGIGRAIAQRLAREGASVVLSARTANELEALAGEIRADGGTASVAVFDLRLPDTPARLVATALKAYDRLDCVVNNAGATKRGEFEQLTDEDWTDGFALKFFGAVRLIRSAWPSLKATSGSVLNIVGVGGRTPGSQFAIGGSVNAALLSLTKALADLGIRDGVRVNTINPGAIRTGRLQTRLAAVMKERAVDFATAEREFIRSSGITRVGEPEDIASLAAFVLSSEGSYLHGALIDMDGGSTKTI